MAAPAPKILISGSGIAGTVSAFWLLRAFPAAQVTIVERAPALRLTGASVDIRSSAVDVIQWMGCEAAIRAHSTNEEGITFTKPNGKEITTFRTTGRTDVQAMTSEFEIFRGDLTRVFLEPIKERVELVFGEMVERYEEKEDGVEVRFTNGRPTETYDLLVACDGLRSKIRGQMLGVDPSEQVHAEQVYCAYFTIGRDLLNGSKLAIWTNFTRGRGIFVRPDPDPAGKCRGHLFSCVPTKGPSPMREKLDTALREGPEAYKRLVEEDFSDLGGLVPEVLKGMRETDDFYCSTFAQVRSPQLVSKRVVLVGDAGYACPGIGTSFAIVGGYVLAGELLRQPGDFAKALQEYEKLMLPYTRSQQSENMGMTWMNPQTQLGLTFRDTIFSAMGLLRIDKLVLAGISWATWLGWGETKLALPDYPWPNGKEQKIATA